MRLKNFWLPIIAGLSLIAVPAQATLLYGVQFGNSNLVTVDSVTGVVQNVGLLPAGSSNLDPIQGLTGTAGGNLLYTDGLALGGVHMLDPTNAGLITTYPLDAFITGRGGLTFDSASNTLFTASDIGVLVAQAGLGGPVAPIAHFTPLFPGALGGDDNGRHFVSAQDVSGLFAIFEFDPFTGGIVNALQFFAPFEVSGLAFDGTFLYATTLVDPFIFTLNPDDGNIINGVPLVSDIQAPITALASVTVNTTDPGQVPVPATLALLGLGLLGFSFRKRQAQA